MSSKPLLFVILLLLGASQVLFAQDDVTTQIQQLKADIQSLHAQLDSLKAAQGSPEAVGQTDLDELETQLTKRITDLENKVDAVSRAAAGTVLNPRITAFFNLAARHDNARVMDYSNIADISNKMYLRTFEMDLRNAVDPYADAVAIISVENLAGTGYAVDPEEVYGVIKRLPILESAPLGMKLKVGRFRAPFGVSNITHMHDMPWTTRPLIVAQYLGTDHGDFFESGYNPVGADIQFFIPGFLDDITKEINVSMVRSDQLGLPHATYSGSSLALVSHLNLSKDWDNVHLVNVGLSFYGEGQMMGAASNDSGATHLTLAGLDFTYKWTPAEERESHSFVMGGELMSGSHAIIDTVANALVRSRPYGWYAYAQYQTSYWVYLGVRYDWLQEPTFTKPVTRNLAAYATYYTSEFLRFRIGYENRWSDVTAENNVSTWIFDINFVFGSHPTEPYWVNR